MKTNESKQTVRLTADELRAIKTVLLNKTVSFQDYARRAIMAAVRRDSRKAS